MARSRPSFFSPIALVVLTALLSAALYILFPREAVYDGIDQVQEPDALSLAYLEALLRSDPGNDSLRLTLSRLQGKAGRLDQALATLAPLTQEDTVVGFDVYQHKASLLAEKLFREPAGEARQRVSDALLDWLVSAMAPFWTVEQRQAILASSSRWLPPADHLQVLQHVYRQAEGAFRFDLGQQLVRQYLALEQQDKAADVLATLLPLAEGPRLRELQQQRLELELARGRPGSALDIFRQMHRGSALDSEGLRRGIELATLAGNDGLRQRWLSRLAELEPQNTEVQRALLARQLGEGDLSNALKTARRVVAVAKPPTIDDLRRLARLAEWTGHPDEALEHWYAVLQQVPDQEASQRAEALARQRLDWQRLADILRLRHERRGLTDAEHVLLADTLVRLGELDAARQQLEEALATAGDSRLIRQRLVSLLSGQRRLPEAIALLEKAPELPETERLELARLYWRTRQPGKALAQLEEDFSDPDLADEAQGLRIDLALILGDEAQLRSAYTRLLQPRQHPLPEELQERLLNLAIQFEDAGQVVALAGERFSTTGNSRYLAIRAEFQRVLGQWEALAQTLAQWQQHDPGHAKSAQYWSLTGELLHHRGQADAAEAALHRAARLKPENQQALVRWGWFLVSHPQRLPGALPRILSTLAQNPTESNIALLAWGHAALGNRQRSLDWFAAAGPAAQEDPLWLLAHAEQLQQAGRYRDAEERIRRVNRLGNTQSLSATELLQVYRLSHQHRRAWPILTGLAGNRRPSGSVASATDDAAIGYALEQDQALLAEALLTPEQRRQRLYPAPAQEQTQQHAIQLSHSRQDLGRLGNTTTQLTGMISGDARQWQFTAETLTATDAGLLTRQPGRHQQGQVTVQSNQGPYRWAASLGTRAGLRGDRLSAGLSMATRPADSWNLALGYRLREAVPDSAEAWWLAARDRAFLQLDYTPFSRLTLTQGLDHYRLRDHKGGDTGRGLIAETSARYHLFRNDPAWTLGLDYRHQQASLDDALSPPLAGHLATGTTPGQIFTDEYRRVGLSSEWRHGEPGSLLRSGPSPRLYLRLDTGYVLSNSTTDFGAAAGVGWRLLGDDELALAAGWTSEGPGGDESRASLTLTYTLYLGK